MRELAAVAVLVVFGAGACVVDDAAGVPPTDRSADTALGDATLVEQDATADVCALAAALPADDLCALVCDPDAFAARMAEIGMATGSCYQFRCALSAELTVSVGVCLP